MNPWKVSTVVLAAACVSIVGLDAVHGARAAERVDGVVASQGPSAWDWGVEQPHMEAALRDLHAARHSLEVAAENKGGWRALALKHTDEAIAETERGIEYGKHHPRE